MEMTSYEPGTPSWIDIGVPDLGAAMSFYGGLFGWEFDEPNEAAGGYSQARLRGHAVAGFGPQMSPGAPFWTTYISTVDADASAAAVAAAGGQVVMAPMDVMDVGRMAVLTDPAGAFFCVWQPKLHPGAGLVNEPGTLCWNELATREPTEAKAFYATVFGWGAQDNPMGPDEVYTEWQLGDRSIGGMMTLDDRFPAEVPDHWLAYFAVEDAEAAAARIAELGGAIIQGPFPSPAGTIAIAKDPAGAIFAVIALSAEM